MNRGPTFNFATNNTKPDGDGINTDKTDKIPPVLKKKAVRKTKVASVEVEAKPEKKTKKAKKDTETPEVKKTEHKLYTLKFNSPILPYAKFPLT
jgi:ATP-dependent Lon protease